MYTKVMSGDVLPLWATPFFFHPAWSSVPIEADCPKVQDCPQVTEWFLCDRARKVTVSLHLTPAAAWSPAAKGVSEEGQGWTSSSVLPLHIQSWRGVCRTCQVTPAPWGMTLGFTLFLQHTLKKMQGNLNPRQHQPFIAGHIAKLLLLKCPSFQFTGMLPPTLSLTSPNWCRTPSHPHCSASAMLWPIFLPPKPALWSFPLLSSTGRHLPPSSRFYINSLHIWVLAPQSAFSLNKNHNLSFPSYSAPGVCQVRTEFPRTHETWSKKSFSSLNHLPFLMSSTSLCLLPW